MDDELLERLTNSRKYRGVCRDTLERVLAECLTKYKKPREIEKAAKERLHGITGAFFSPGEYRALSALIVKTDGADDALLAEILRRHVSTAERLPLAAMDAMYSRIFAATGPPESVLDLACGLNPVYLCARLPETCRITGTDINGGCVELINHAPGAPRAVRAIHADLLCENGVPSERFHIALLFKILPLLNRQKPGAAGDVLSRVNAKYLAVSFPTRTLSGRSVGMEKHYREEFEAICPDKFQVFDRFVQTNELVYILKER